MKDFRRKVGNRPEQIPRLARPQRPGHRLGDPEVRDLGYTGLVDEDVLRLDIAVDDALFVGVLQRRGDLRPVAGSFGFGHAALRLEDLTQRVPVDVLSDDEATVLPVSRVVYSNDVWMLQAGDDTRFAFERRYGFGVRTELVGLVKHLYGDPTAEAPILRQPHLGHTASSEQPLEAVSSFYDICGVHCGMSLRTFAVSRERNVELLLLLAASAILTLGWLSLRAADFPLPGNTVRILTQFGLSGLAVHLALRAVAPSARPESTAIAVALAFLGMIFVIRLAPPVVQDQANWMTIGMLTFATGAVMGSRYNVLKRYTFSAGATALAILFVTGVFGTTINGARLWITIGGQTIQTTELIKVFVVLFLAGYLTDSASVLASPRLRIGDRTYSGAAYIVPLLGVVLGAVAALALLRDLGSIALLLLLAVSVLYVATGRARFILGGLGLLAITGFIGYLVFDHAAVRVDVWLDPASDPAGTGYQALQGTYAIQAGGITGEGLGLGQPDAIPAAPTDYVFSAIAEELGLAGAVGVILLYVVLLHAGLRVAAESRDTYGRLLATSIALLFAIQAAVIIAGNLRVIPTTGITLPFVSYGGSSLVVNLGLVGLLAGISHAGRQAVFRGRQ